MSVRKVLLVLVMPLVCAAFLSSQDLVELAKKERARRARAQDKKARVVTNNDLRSVNAKSGVSSRTVQGAESEVPRTTLRSNQPGAGDAEPQSDSAVRVTVEPGTNPDQMPPELSLEERLRRAETRVGHLSLRLTQLGQLFYGAQTPERRDELQKQMDRTSRELEKARSEADGFRAELERKKK